MVDETLIRPLNKGQGHLFWYQSISHIRIPTGLSIVIALERLIEHGFICLHQHNIGYTADGFYRSDDPTNSVKALKEGG